MSRYGFDYTRMTGRTEEDQAAIDQAMEKELELFVDEYDRVWTNQIDGIYIADVIISEEA